MAENLRQLGMAVSLVEMLNQVMAPFDFEMAQLIHKTLEKNGVSLYLGNGVTSFTETDESILVNLSDGKQLTTRLVILAIGVKPNSDLARSAGLAMNARGGIVVDKALRTSDPNIYAVGDVIEVEDFINKGKTMIPLAGPANKQGRIAANNIAGENDQYQGTQGSAIVKIFDLCAANTGTNEKTLLKNGFVKGKDYEKIIILQNSHASYYPGASPMAIKLLFSTDGNKIFGAQIIGKEGVDKRIDTIGTAIRLGGTIWDLKSLEFAYAPPFSSAKDPVNMAGFVAENVLSHTASFIEWDEVDALLANPDKKDTFVILDVTEEMERMVYSIPGSYHIPLGQIRNRIKELDQNKLIIPYCAIGVRSYNAARILMKNGFEQVRILSGGTSYYKSMHYEDRLLSVEAKEENKESDFDMEDKEMKILDCSGMQCPGPIMKVNETLKEMEDGEVLKVSATDMGFAADVDSWCRRTGNTLVKTERQGKENIVYIRKGTGQGLLMKEKAVGESVDGKTIIVFSGDLDKVLASFIIANGAAAMGRKVTMFFTFWGLNALRKSQSVPVRKPFMDKMFGAMMPKGAGKLKISKMNMGGMGTAMIRKVMNDKNVDSVEMLMKHAMENGVKLIACTMSMDIMGITKEELIDGVELAGVASYLGDAEESNVNLFI